MKNMKDRLFLGFVKTALAWTVLALTFQITMFTLSIVNPELATRVGNELTWKLDSRFKNK